MHSARLLTVAGVSAALIVAGCGKSAEATKSPTQTTSQSGSSSESKNAYSGAPIPAAELRSLANSICRRVAARRASNRAQTSQEVARVTNELASFEQTVATELAQLNPPARLASSWHQIVAGAKLLAQDTAKVSEYARSGQLSSTATTATINSRKQLEEHTAAIATHTGIKDCGEAI